MEAGEVSGELDWVEVSKRFICHWSFEIFHLVIFCFNYSSSGDFEVR
jgi:hypothetical protein